MNSSRRKFAAILEALGLPPSSRRTAATPAAPACEPLEGRQLLASGAGLMVPGMGMADVSGQGFGPGGPMTLGAVDALAFGSGQGSMAPGLASNPARASLKADLEQLRFDTQAIHDQSQVTPVMEHAVSSDIKAIKAAETTTPSQAALTALQAATKSVEANVGGPSLGQVFQVEVAQNAVYLSEGVGAGPITQLDANEAAVANATGITAADEAILAADNAAVQADQAKLPASANPTASTIPTSTASASTPAIAPTAGSFGPMGFAGRAGMPGSMGLPGMSLMSEFGMAPMAGQGLTSSSSTPAAPTADQATLTQDLLKLQADTEAVHDKSLVTPAMEAVVRQDLTTIHGAATTAPNSADLTKLQADGTTAQAGTGGPTDAQMAQVQADQAAVFGSEGVNATLVAKLGTDQATVKAASGITAADEAALAADASVVKADRAKLAPTGSTTPPTTPTPTGMGQGPSFRGMDEGFGRGEFGPRG